MSLTGLPSQKPLILYKLYLIFNKIVIKQCDPNLPIPSLMRISVFLPFLARVFYVILQMVLATKIILFPGLAHFNWGP